MTGVIEREAALAVDRQARRRASVALDAAMELYVISHGTAALVARLDAEAMHLREIGGIRSTND